MARTKPSDLLALIDRMFDRRDRKEAREQEMSLRILSMEHSDDVREDQQAFQKEIARDSHNRNFLTKYPGAIMQDDGYYAIPEGYDYTASADFKQGQAINIEEDLREHGLSTEGTSMERQNRLGVFLQARSKGANMMTPTISPDIAYKTGGDVSPGFLTQRDVADFREIYEGYGGADSPLGLQQLVDANIINTDHLQWNKDRGIYEANDTSKELIDVALDGLVKGLKANESYKTNEEYEGYTNQQRQQNLLYAESLTGLPDIVRATNIFNSTKSAIGQKLSRQIVGDEVAVIWDGELKSVSDIKEAVSKTKNVFATDAERAAFNKFLDTVLTIMPDGMGMEWALEMVKANPRMLKILDKFDGALADGLRMSGQKFNSIEKVSRLASGFVQQPQDPNKASEFRSFLQSSGLVSTIQKLRSMDVSGQSNTEEYKNLDKTYTQAIGSIIEKLHKEGNKKMLSELQRWMELEEASSQLFKESAKQRRNK